jgi:hypothetical protein
MSKGRFARAAKEHLGLHRDSLRWMSLAGKKPPESDEMPEYNTSSPRQPKPRVQPLTDAGRPDMAHGRCCGSPGITRACRGLAG